MTGARVRAHRDLARVSFVPGLAHTLVAFVANAVATASFALRHASLASARRSRGFAAGGGFGRFRIDLARIAAPSFDAVAKTLARAGAVSGTLADARFDGAEFRLALWPIPSVVAETRTVDAVPALVAIFLAHAEFAIGSTVPLLTGARTAHVGILETRSVSAAGGLVGTVATNGIETVVAAPTGVTLADTSVLVAGSVVVAFVLTGSLRARGSPETGLTNTSTVTTVSAGFADRIATLRGACSSLVKIGTSARTVETSAVSVTILRT